MSKKIRLCRMRDKETGFSNHSSDTENFEYPPSLHEEYFTDVVKATNRIKFDEKICLGDQTKILSSKKFKNPFFEGIAKGRLIQKEKLVMKSTCYDEVIFEKFKRCRMKKFSKLGGDRDSASLVLEEL